MPSNNDLDHAHTLCEKVNLIISWNSRKDQVSRILAMITFLEFLEMIIFLEFPFLIWGAF